MAWWSFLLAGHLWPNALAAIPLALLVGAICRWVPCRPTTRHTLWLIVLLWFLGAPLLPALVLPAERTGPVPADTSSPFAIAAGSERATRAATSARSVSGTDEARRDDPESIGGDLSRTDPHRAELVEALAQDAPGNPHDKNLGGVAPAFVDERDPGVHTTTRQNPPRRAARSIGSSSDSAPAFVLADRELLPEHPDPIAVPALELGDLSLPPTNDTALFPSARPSASGNGMGAFAWLNDEGPGERLHARHPTKLQVMDDWHVPPPSVFAATPAGKALEAYSNATSTLGVDASADGGQPGGWRFVSDWKRWVVGLVAVRDAIGRLPAVPTGIWLGGAALFALLTAFRIAAYRYKLRAAVPAPQQVRQMVSEAAREMGLRRPPETWVISNRSSPLVWCGWRTRLILPGDLWDQLDDIGRRAVVLHELAHLARRDHWVCWLEVIVGAVYWWHPLVWWARHRLHEEADLCCDAWVTWVLPRARRAYAEALLTTRHYLNETFQAVPAIGIGVLSPRAQRLARRIRIVMTDNVVPRRSITAMVTAAALVIAGWAATPAQSSLLSAATEIAVSHAAAVDSGGNPVTVASRPAAAEKTETGDVRQRLARLESQMDRLSDKIRALTESVAVRPAFESGLATMPLEVATSLPDSTSWADATLLAQVAGDEDEATPVVREYALPEGKLEALAALMSRSDVPLKVRPDKDRIAVEATPAQQAVVAAFVNLIHPSEGIRPDEVLPPVPLFILAPPESLTLPGESPWADGAAKQSRGSRLESQVPEGELESWQYEQRALALKTQARVLESRASVLVSEAAELRNETDRLAKRAHLREQSALKLEGADREQAVSQSRALAARVRVLRDRTRWIEEQARGFEEQARQYDHLADKDFAESRRLEQQTAASAERIRKAQEEADTLRP